MAELRPFLVDLEGFGQVNVFVQGNLEKCRDGVVFLTIHDCGSSYQHWVDFVLEESMFDIRNRAVFLHLCVPGQEPGAEPLTKPFPTFDQMGLNLVTVLDTLRVNQVVGLGEGAGANILARFAMKFPARVVGLVAVNFVAEASQGYVKDKMKSTVRVDESLNFSNVALYLDAYKKRADILSKLRGNLKSDIILIVGGSTKLYQDSLKIHKQISPGLCSVLKIDGAKDPTLESAGKVAESVLLFCQGLGLMPTLNRRGSRLDSTSSTGSGRRPSMTEMDIPNIGRLSLSTCPVHAECAEAK